MNRKMETALEYLGRQYVKMVEIMCNSERTQALAPIHSLMHPRDALRTAKTHKKRYVFF